MKVYTMCLYITEPPNQDSMYMYQHSRWSYQVLWWSMALHQQHTLFPDELWKELWAANVTRKDQEVNMHLHNIVEAPKQLGH